MVVPNLRFEKTADIFDARDFQSLEIRIDLQRIPNSKKTDLRFELLEMEKQSVTVDAPDEFCTLGHRIFLEMEVSGLPVFTATAKVVVVDSLGNGRARAQINLVQYDIKSWKDVRNSIAVRQEQITSDLREAKGY